MPPSGAVSVSVHEGVERVTGFNSTGKVRETVPEDGTGLVIPQFTIKEAGVAVVETERVGTNCEIEPGLKPKAVFWLPVAVR